MGVSASIRELLAGTLAELGIPVPADILQTTLMKDYFFVGHKFCYCGGYAIVRAGGSTVEFYNELGTLLKTVAIDIEKDAAA